MYKKIIGLALASILLLPVAVYASEKVPQEVEEGIKKDLERFKPSLVESKSFKISSEKEADDVDLGPGVKYYVIEPSAWLR